MKPLPILKPNAMSDNSPLAIFLKITCSAAFILFLSYIIIKPGPKDDENDQDRLDPPAIKLE